MKAFKRRWLLSLIVLIALVTAHEVLRRGAVDRNIAAALLSPSNATPTVNVLWMACLLGVRLLLILALPGVVLARSGAWLTDRWIASRKEIDVPCG